MNILIMCRWYYPHCGGATVRVHNFAKYLTKAGHNVHILTHNPKSIEQCNKDDVAPLFEESAEGFKITRLPYRSFLGLKGNWGTSIPEMAVLATKIIEKENIDIIMSHNPPYLVGASSYKASFATGVPFVTIVHDIWGASHYGALENAVGKTLEAFVLKKSKKIIVPVEGIGKELSETYGIPKERFATAKTGVDSNEFRPIAIGLKEKAILREKLLENGAPKEKINDCLSAKSRPILFLGNLAPWKGGMFFLRAAKEILKEEPSAFFVLVGHGAQFEELISETKKLGISDRVLFAGVLRHEDLPLIINLAKVCVSTFPKPSSVGRKANMQARPVSTLEFLSCGRPVVVSDVPGIRDIIIKDGESGILFEPENIGELTKGVLLLLKKKGKAESLGREARKNIKDETWEVTAKVVEMVLNEVLKD